MATVLMTDGLLAVASRIAGDAMTAAALPAWFWMWSLAGCIYSVCKIASWSMCRAAAPRWKHIGYLLAWPGMNGNAFFGSVSKELRPVRVTEWTIAAANLGLGAGIVFVGASDAFASHVVLRGWVGMIGIVLTLHFGLFHVLSCLWRSIGVGAVPLMNWPVLAESVTEFWGRRWNLAFRDLTYRLVFVPGKRVLGPAGALFAGFIASGIVHDLVISWPSGGGCGLPTLYFAIQGVAVVLERSGRGRAWGLGAGMRGRLFAIVIVLLPCPLLFHPPFVRNVIVPFLSVLGGIA